MDMEHYFPSIISFWLFSTRDEKRKGEKKKRLCLNQQATKMVYNSAETSYV